MYRIPLDVIKDNPYQTRSQYANIEDLAASIYGMRQARRETSGLVQVPPARLWDVDANLVLDPANFDDLGDLLAVLHGGLVVVQLAAGHRRFRAFQHLAGNVQHDGYEYHTFPVELGVYSDEAMADLVWTENHDRDDLTAIEEAEALQRDMQAFGWTQAEIGFRRGLSRSAVANKLRLLKLPEKAQTAIRTGQISERHGRVLLKAHALSEAIYKDLVANIIPPRLRPTAEAKARELYEKGASFFRSVGPKTACAACGIEFSHVYLSKNHAITLCPDCFRAASGWEPPSVANTENTLETLTRMHSKPINFFPVDVEIGEAITGEQVVRQTKCLGCPALTENRRGDYRCIDSECYKHKTEAWQCYLSATLKDNLRQRWPDLAYQVRTLFNEHAGCRLRAHDDTDRYLAEHVCSPTCKRFRMEHYPWGGDGYIKLTNDPFIASCDNAQSHGACVRKLATNEQANEALAEHNADLAEQTQRELQAKTLRKRAEAAIAQALKDGRPAVFNALASAMHRGITDPYRAIARWLTDQNYYSFNVNQFLEWTPEKVSEYKQRVASQLNGWDIPLPAGPDQLIDRFERIDRFVDQHWQTLTDQQIAGNIDNLEKLNDEIHQAFTLKLLTEADFGKLAMLVVDLRGRLVDAQADRVSQETFQEEVPCLQIGTTTNVGRPSATVSETPHG